MMGREEPHFSFAGLKTAVRVQAKALVPLKDQDIADLCAAFEQAVAESVGDRVRRAMRMVAGDERSPPWPKSVSDRRWGGGQCAAEGIVAGCG